MSNYDKDLHSVYESDNYLKSLINVSIIWALRENFNHAFIISKKKQHVTLGLGNSQQGSDISVPVCKTCNAYHNTVISQ